MSEQDTGARVILASVPTAASTNDIPPPAKARDVAADLSAVASTEARRVSSVGITGSDGADDELLAYYDGYDDEAKRKRAFKRYVVDGVTAEKISRELKVPAHTVRMWAYNGKWNRVAARDLSVRVEEEERTLVGLRLSNRRILLAQQVDDSVELQKKLMENVREGNVSMKSAAESLAAIAKVQNSAMGIADSGAVVTRYADGDDAAVKSGKTPLVVVVNNQSGSGIPVLGKRAEVVDV